MRQQVQSIIKRIRVRRPVLPRLGSWRKTI